LIQVLEDEKAGAQIATSTKVKCLKSLATKWHFRFPQPCQDATEGAGLVIGIMVHILSECVSEPIPDAYLCEASLITITVVLESCLSFDKFLPPHSMLKIVAMTSMVFPSSMVGAARPNVEADSQTSLRWNRSEDCIHAAVRCLSVLLRSKENQRDGNTIDTTDDGIITWLHVPGDKVATHYSRVHSRYYSEVSMLLEGSEEGRGVLAQLVQSMLMVVKGGEDKGWPKGRLPRETSLLSITILTSLCEMLSHSASLWRSFIPGICSQVCGIISTLSCFSIYLVAHASLC
jgi:hypothetical protein